MQEWTGLAISNYNASRSKSCLVLYGSVGNTGKTKYLNMLREILGEENICSTEIQNLSSRFGPGELYGKRANLIDDQRSTNITEISKFKSITGGGITSAEHKYLPSFNFIYKGVFIMAANDLPQIYDDNGEHLYQRFMIMPCNNVVPKEKRDSSLLDKLIKEKDGIVLWALEGLQRLIGNEFRFTHSKMAADALEEFRSGNDSFYKFISTNYMVTKNDKERIRKSVLDAEYLKWCDIEDLKCIDKKSIKIKASKLGISCKRMNDSIYYRGLVKK
jgi:P4 family phage/plasmid primase-like protien